jgi:hypothetical protein
LVMSFVIWELTWNDNLPFLRYIKPARSCIIATWLLVMSFVMWELAWNGKLSFCKIHQAIQGWHHCKMAVNCVFFDLGADEKQKSPVFKLHQPSHAASLQHGCWLWHAMAFMMWESAWHGILHTSQIFKTSQGLHHRDTAVLYDNCDFMAEAHLGEDVKRKSPASMIH